MLPVVRILIDGVALQVLALRKLELGAVLIGEVNLFEFLDQLTVDVAILPECIAHAGVRGTASVVKGKHSYGSVSVLTLTGLVTVEVNGK